MRCWRLLSLAVLLTVLVPVRGNFDDFSLEDALVTTKKPVPSQKPSPSDFDDFNLEDAFQPDDPKPGPPANPRDTDNPRQGPSANPKESENFDDSDLSDSSLPIGGGDSDGSNDRKGASPNDGEQSEASGGTIAGIVSAVFATVIGAVSSFIAYQKKKLCFKQSADEENVNMESRRGAQSEPPEDDSYMKESSNSKSFYNGDSCGRTSFKAMETVTISPFQFSAYFWRNKETMKKNRTWKMDREPAFCLRKRTPKKHNVNNRV